MLSASGGTNQQVFNVAATSTQGQGGKPCFVFVIDVQRIDITSQREDGADLHWSVQRRYSEFYTLEAKLTEFHGEFEDVRLPSKAKFWKGLDVLQGKRQVSAGVKAFYFCVLLLFDFATGLHQL